MSPNPILGVFFHWLGGLASGSFYVPFRGVKQWSWETAWLVGGVFSWIVAPWTVALIMTRDPVAVLQQSPANSLFWAYVFGVLWGFGGLTFGLTMRYLGMSLGMAVALGYCAAFGTLIPPIFHGEFATRVLGTVSGQVILLGITVCLGGIGLAGLAGISKESEMPEEQKREAIREFDLKKGLLIAAFSGIMSACFSFGLAAAQPIAQVAIRSGSEPLWQGLPALIVVLAGGFTTNAVWCLVLNYRNRTGHEYFTREPKPGTPAPMLSNYLFAALAGTTWYFQFFFYTMGESQMGAYRFSSWTMHMASIIIFSTLWGIALREWKGTSARTRRLLVASLAVLVASTTVIGYGNYIGTESTQAVVRAKR